jgi:hypothetical protein
MECLELTKREKMIKLYISCIGERKFYEYNL